MGRSGIPFIILIVVVSAAVAAVLLPWTELPNWLVLLLAPVVGYVGLFLFGRVVDLIEKGRGPASPAGEGHEEPEFIVPELPKGLRCPSCDSRSIATILYGLLPHTRELATAIEKKTVTCGGCAVYPDAPVWVCNDCGYKFGAVETVTEGE